jgi:hypothetical protein
MSENQNDNYVPQSELDEMLYARHVEIESLGDLEAQRGTPIPALMSTMYKFVQNPSSVSIETYKRMVDTDDTIGSGVDFLVTCLAGRLGAYQHKSPEITQWVKSALGEIKGGFRCAVKEMLSATWAGFSVTEKVWANKSSGFVIDQLVTLPPHTVLFEVERTGELTPDGILQYQRNWNPLNVGYGIGFFGGLTTAGFGFSSPGASPDPFAKFGDLPFPLRTANMYNYLSIRIPKQKCIHYSHKAQGNFGNPYGRSLLRRAYKWWVMKDAFLRMLAVALDRKGTPLTIVYADPNATLADPKKVGSNAAGAARGKAGVAISAPVAAAMAFRNIHNDTTVILPGKKGEIFNTDFVPQASNADEFMSSIGLCNVSMMRALLIPSLIFANGDGTGSYALGQEHARTFEKILDSMLDGFTEVILDQVVRDLLMYNFPRSAWEKDGLGSFSKREFTAEEMEKMSAIYERAITGGVIDPTDLADLNKMREAIGFEPKTEEEMSMTMAKTFDTGGNENGM